MGIGGGVGVEEEMGVGVEEEKMGIGGGRDIIQYMLYRQGLSHIDKEYLQ
jgi:hypothetical protein